MILKIVIVVLFIAMLASLSSGLVFLMKDMQIPDSKRALYALGIRIGLATLPAGLADLAPPGPGTGRGSGDGGTSDAGRFTVTPPAPRALILPTFADELKERGAEIWVWVDVTGRVVPDSTRLRPPTSDRGLNQRLRDEAADWRFEPARRGDEAVASWYNYRVRTGG